jgi:hypothetical protein
MEQPALAAPRAAGVQAPEADLPSLPSRRCQDCPPTRTALDDVLGRAMPGGAARHAGQPGQEDRRGGWGEEPATPPTARLGPLPDGGRQSPTGPAGLDPQTRRSGAAAARHPHHAGPRQPNPGTARLGTGMGGSLRAEQLRVPPRALLPRCDPGRVRRSLSEGEIRARRGYRGVLGAIVTLPPWCR